MVSTVAHPTFDVLIISWELTLPADAYAADTVKAYQNAVRSLAGWLRTIPTLGRSSWNVSTCVAGWSTCGRRDQAARREGGSRGAALLPLASG